MGRGKWFFFRTFSPLMLLHNGARRLRNDGKSTSRGVAWSCSFWHELQISWTQRWTSEREFRSTTNTRTIWRIKCVPVDAPLDANSNDDDHRQQSRPFFACCCCCCFAFNNIIDIVHRPFGFTCYWFSAASDLLRCWWCYSPRPVLSASLWKLELRDLLGNGLLEWLCVSGMAVLLVDKLGSLREVVWNGHLVGYLGNPEMILWGESLDRQIDSPPLASSETEDRNTYDWVKTVRTMLLLLRKELNRMNRGIMDKHFAGIERRWSRAN